jgi:hypothetical protein
LPVLIFGLERYSLPGNICNTIRQAKKHNGADVNADSIIMFISLVNAKIQMMEEHLNYIFNKIHQHIIPHKIKQYFSGVYLICLYKDPNDKSKLRPLSIPTAVRQLMATHVTKTFKEKFARRMLPFNYTLGTPSGANLIINTMQLQVEKYISTPMSKNLPPTWAAVFFDLTNTSTLSPATRFSK